MINLFLNSFFHSQSWKLKNPSTYTWSNTPILEMSNKMQINGVTDYTLESKAKLRNEIPCLLSAVAEVLLSIWIPKLLFVLVVVVAINGRGNFLRNGAMISIFSKNKRNSFLKQNNITTVWQENWGFWIKDQKRKLNLLKAVTKLRWITVLL